MIPLSGGPLRASWRMSVFSESWSPATASAWAVSAFQAAQPGIRVLRARMNPAAHKPAVRTAFSGCDDEHIRVRRVAPPENAMTRIRAEVVPGEGGGLAAGPSEVSLATSISIRYP